MGLVVAAHGLSCSKASGIFLDQDWTCVPCTGRQSHPLCHQGSPKIIFLNGRIIVHHLDICAIICLITVFGLLLQGFLNIFKKIWKPIIWVQSLVYVLSVNSNLYLSVLGHLFCFIDFFSGSLKKNYFSL